MTQRLSFARALIAHLRQELEERIYVPFLRRHREKSPTPRIS